MNGIQHVGNYAVYDGRYWHDILPLMIARYIRENDHTSGPAHYSCR